MHGSHYDMMIVGQGICGTVLSSSLILQGQKVLVIDDASNKAASKIASGVINPVTGRRIVKTWQIDDVMPAAVRIYQALEKKLDTSIVKQCNIVNFHASEQMQKALQTGLLRTLLTYLLHPYQMVFQLLLTPLWAHRY